MEIDASPILDAVQAREWDEESIRKYGIRSRLLMGWAGYSVFASIRELKAFQKAKEIHFLLGSGNNAGDGYVIAWQILASSQKKIFFWQTSRPKTKDSFYFFELCKNFEKSRIKIDLLEHFKPPNNKNSMIFDALFGVGFKGVLDRAIQKLFKRLNNNDKFLKVAIDIPSGVYTDGGFFQHQPFRADITYTFGGYKIGQLLYPGILFSGDVRVLPIGFIPFPSKSSVKRRFLKEYEPKKLRALDSHKYKNGIIHVYGGSQGMEGAAILSAYSFLRLGGGLIKIYSHSRDIKKVLSQKPEIMFPATKTGQSREETLLADLKAPTKVKKVLVAGIGLKEKPARFFWEELLKIIDLNLILDGSVLRELHEHRQIFSTHKNQSLLLTPHLAEAESLLQDKIANTREAALKISKMYNAFVYLKGAGGILCLPKSHRGNSDPREIYTFSRDSQLAVGGTGDILTGIIANMLFRYDAPLPAIETGLRIYFQNSRKHTQKERSYLTPSHLISEL